MGWVRAPACASARSRAVARHAIEAAIVFLHLSSCAMRWTVPVPIPRHSATLKMPTPSQAASAPYVRSNCLSSADRASRPGNGALEACFDSLANHAPLKFGKGRSGDRPCREILDNLQEPETQFAGGSRGDAQLVTEARSRFEGPYKSLQHQAQD